MINIYVAMSVFTLFMNGVFLKSNPDSKAGLSFCVMSSVLWPFALFRTLTMCLLRGRFGAAFLGATIWFTPLTLLMVIYL